jgi:hypothetical protein
MHRRVFAAISFVIVLSMATPVFATPRRNPGDSFIDQIVLKLKKIFYPTANDLNDITPPKP